MKFLNRQELIIHLETRFSKISEAVRLFSAVIENDSDYETMTKIQCELKKIKTNLAKELYNALREETQ